MKRYCKTLIFILLIAPIIHAQNTSGMFAGWKSVEACNFTFIIPADLQEVKVFGIDSCVRQYRSGSMFIDLDVTIGSATNDEQYFRREGSNRRDFHLIETNVNGAGALITTFYAEEIPEEAAAGYHYAARLFVPHIGKYKQGLWMRAYSKTPEEQARAEKIFESIRFSIKRKRA